MITVWVCDCFEIEIISEEKNLKEGITHLLLLLIAVALYQWKWSSEECALRGDVSEGFFWTHSLGALN